VTTGIDGSVKIEPVGDEVAYSMSEARLNDLVYLIFKQTMDMPPREADLIFMMQMACPDLLKEAGPSAGIVIPGKRAGGSHDKVVRVLRSDLIEATLGYMEDHWWKQELSDEERANWTKVLFEPVLDLALKLPESKVLQPAS
jgi:hypothetical protein